MDFFFGEQGGSVMSLLDFFWERRRRQDDRTPRRTRPHTFRPLVEALEQRDCPSVAAPTGLQLTPLSSTQVKLTWNNVPGELGFHIYEWDGVQTSMIQIVSANTTTFTV